MTTLFYPCPNDNGQNIAYRDCPHCGHPQQKDVNKCWPLVSRWTMEEPVYEAQLELDGVRV